MAGFPEARWYLSTPVNQVPLRSEGHVSVQLRCSKAALLTQRNSRSSRRAHHFRHHLCGPLHNQPPYATLGLAATSILILIVARFSS